MFDETPPRQLPRLICEFLAPPTGDEAIPATELQSGDYVRVSHTGDSLRSPLIHCIYRLGDVSVDDRGAVVAQTTHVDGMRNDWADSTMMFAPGEKAIIVCRYLADRANDLLGDIWQDEGGTSEWHNEAEFTAFLDALSV